VNKIQYLDKIFLFLSLDSSYIFFFFGTGLWTQGLMLAKQAF
jgi:hypothetical protein